jgi:6-oxo-cyclohex-1-ene-carbonyl-CoA hydrolase
LELLDKAVNDVIWKFTNLFPGCLIKSLDSVRAKKKYFWDMAKNYNRHWLAVNMTTEAYLGFQAFNTKKITGQDVIDFIKYRQLIAEGKKYRQLIAEGKTVDEAFMEAVLPKPKE